MHTRVRNELPARTSERGVTRLDLAAMLGVLAFLAAAWLPVLGRTGDGSERALCQGNLSSLVRAVAMYALDNEDALPHPSWGSLSSYSGPDNWCYAGSLPSLGNIPNVEGRGGPLAHTNQMPFFEAGLLAPFARNQREFICPLDWATAMAGGTYGSWWSLRPLKLTSYKMNGAVCGYGGKEVVNSSLGGTYKLSAFTPKDRVLWEADETVPFNFNDAASNPSNSAEGASQRHGQGGANGPAQFSDAAIVGRLGGGAEFVPWRSFGDLRSASTSSRPNELLCGPGYE